MNRHFGQLLKGTSMMSVSGILQKGVGFFLLPLYTRYLSPADYGAVELFLVLLLIVDIVVLQGMASALMKRIVYDDADGGKKVRSIAVSTALLPRYGGRGAPCPRGCPRPRRGPARSPRPA